MNRNIDRFNHKHTPIVKQDLYNLFFLGCIFVYIPILPIDIAECQPYLWLICCFIGLAFIFNFGFKIDSVSALSIALFFFVTARFIADYATYSVNTIDFLRYIFPCAGLFFAFMAKKPPSIIIIDAVIFLHLLMVIFTIIPGFNELFREFMLNIYGRYGKLLLSGTRGISFLSPEPSYAAFYLSVVLATLRIFSETGVKSKMIFRELLLVFLIACTKSIAGVIVIIIYSMSFVFFDAKLRVKIVMIVLLFSAIPAAIEYTRFGKTILRAADYAYSEGSISDVINVASLVEPSGSARIIQNSAALYGAIRRPLGNGLGSYGDKWWYWADNMGWYVLPEHEVLSEHYLERRPLAAHAIIPQLSHDIGLSIFVWFSAFLMIIFRCRKSMKSSTNFFIFGLCIIFFLYQSQMTNPSIWYLLALYYYSSREKSTLSLYAKHKSS